MNGFYSITTALFNELTSAGFKVVTLGDYFKTDIARQTIFPLAHIVPQTATIPGDVDLITFSIIGMDLVDFNKADLRDAEQPFYGIDNLQDVLNDIHNRLSLVAEQFRRGTAYDFLFHLEGVPSLNPFFERFENLLAGWELEITFKLPSNTPIC